MAKVFVIDVARCNGCYACQIGCKDEHVANDWMPYTKPQPNTGQFWGKLCETVRGNTPHVKLSHVFLPCQHCDDAPCISACPADAISRRADGLVIINPKTCNGCQNCLHSDACPYGVIYFNEDLNIAQKCTGCAHLLDRGWPITEPRCVDNCPRLCIRFGEESEFSSEIAQAETLHPEFGLSPRVHYLNLPKKFIAGTVYTPSDMEVAIGASCTLTGEGDTFTTTTDSWGDFWFNGLEDDGTYDLVIEAAGKTKTISDISTEKDVGLADIALS